MPGAAMIVLGIAALGFPMVATVVVSCFVGWLPLIMISWTGISLVVLGILLGVNFAGGGIGYIAIWRARKGTEQNR